MFKSHALKMAGDHVDFSFRQRDGWPPLQWKSLEGLGFRMGDADVGPTVNVAAFTFHGDEILDWEHTVDPMHFHGTDQFRLEVDGSWITNGHPLESGSYGYQASGRVYQEHPGELGRSWLVLVYGDKRGQGATFTLARDREALGVEAIAGQPVATANYPHPAGPKGTVAIVTSTGVLERGYLWGSFAERDTWPAVRTGVTTTAGVFGDAEAGPLALLLSAAADQIVAPACTYDTEAFLVVSRGSCRIDDVNYEPGDMRVQCAGEPLGAIVAGPDGVDLLLMFGDRRGARTAVTNDDEGTAWMSHLRDVSRELEPSPAR
jgi:hypothetical protein